MNFQELYNRIREIDEGTIEQTGLSTEGCGDMPISVMSSPTTPKQSDSVTMNVSMNGSGAGGIRDLMGILKNIEGNSGSEPIDHEEPIMGDDYSADGGFRSATSEPNEVTLDIDSVIPTGDDLHSHGGNEVEKVNGGGNPYTNISETLVQRLADHYNSIKD